MSTWTSIDSVTANAQGSRFDASEYERGSFLGKGGWSTVWKVRRVRDGQLFAGKICYTAGKLRAEARIMRGLRHRHLLRFIELHEEKRMNENEADKTRRGLSGNALLLITELCPHGSLQKHIDLAVRQLTRRDILAATQQIASALEYLHVQNLYHSDLKPRNILVRAVEPGIDVVVADLADVTFTTITTTTTNRTAATGRSQKASMGTRRGTPAASLRGTPLFHSPEVVQRQCHSGPGDDMWAVGVTMLAMMRQMPLLPSIAAENPSKDDINQGIKSYPGCCAEHAGKLAELNPEEDMVGVLLVRLLTGEKNRMRADECAEMAQNMARGREEDDLVIEAPPEFRPMTFW